MEAIESKVSQGGLLRWLDYRVPLGLGCPACISISPVAANITLVRSHINS